VTENHCSLRRLQSAGVILLAGTDIAGDRVPGFSLHQELDAFATAGLSPLQVLQSATLNPAVVMKRTTDYGTVEPGKIADLILLDADPTKTVNALHSIDQDGRWAKLPAIKLPFVA
jgi:imidazolonepropionase-like amidohydrolase